MNPQNEDASIIYYYIIMKKSKNQIQKENKFSKQYVESLIKRFERNWIIRKRANRCILNKKKKLSCEHLDFLKEILSKVISYPHRVSSLKTRLLHNFEDLKEVSDSTLRRNLRKQLNMSSKKLTIMNPKTLAPDSFNKMVQSAALLKALSDYDIELIFIDEFSMNSRSSKVYGWAERGKKSLIIQHYWNVSFNVITVLSSKQFYPSFVK